MRFATNSDDGARIAYDLVGEGAPLLLFHGSLTSREWWRTLGYVDELRVAHQLILVDARGHGQSDKPTTMEGYAMELLVGDVIAVLDDCEVPDAAYFGYSMGGRVGFGLGIRAPERVRALILGGASHRPQNGWFDRLIYPGFVDTIETEGIESFLARWSERLGRAVDPTVRAVFLGNDPRALVPYLRQIDREPGFRGRAPLEYAASRIAVRRRARPRTAPRLSSCSGHPSRRRTLRHCPQRPRIGASPSLRHRAACASLP
jgi:pimeloyl-ACP methyl ester carboxylesterase